MRGAFTGFTLLFTGWGFGFGWLAATDFFRAAMTPNVGVGTSAAVMMGLLTWIGGMILFGGGALIFKPTTLPEVAAPAAAAASPAGVARQSDWPSDPSVPRPGNHTLAVGTGTFTHAGREYRTYGDGRVLAHVSGQPMTWQSEAGFKAWAEREWDERRSPRAGS